LLTLLRSQSRFDEGLQIANELLEISQRYAINDRDSDSVARAQIEVAWYHLQLKQHASANILLV
jgi:pyruvate-formate lyase